MDALLHLEKLKYNLLLNYQRDLTMDNRLSDTAKMHKEPLIIHGYPVFSYALAGTLPLNNTTDHDLKQEVRGYIEWCIGRMYDNKSKYLPFHKAKVFIQHFYENDIIQDLDNRNHKYIVDALRLAQIIEDDSWQHLSLDVSGYKDNFSHVQVYVVEDENELDFAGYLKSHTHKLKDEPTAFKGYLEKYKEGSTDNRVEYPLVEERFFW